MNTVCRSNVHPGEAIEMHRAPTETNPETKKRFAVWICPNCGALKRQGLRTPKKRIHNRSHNDG
jgi:hypothetical protein